MMNDKLQLNEIVGYLPYGLEGKYTLSDVVKIAEWQKDEIRDKKLTEDCVQFFRLYCKPILRPLSDLKKEIEVNGESFVPLDRLKLDSCLDYNVEFNNYFSLLYTISDLQKLYQWHFDIYNLINRNLAIDINTLKNER